MSQENTSPGTQPAAAPAGGGISPADVDAARREAQATERKRVSEIKSLAVRFNLPESWVERHTAGDYSVEQARQSALDAVETMQRDQAGIQERERVRLAEIDMLATRHDLPKEFVEKAKRDKTTIESFRGLVLDFTHSRGAPQPLSSSPIDWSGKEAARYSIRKAINAQLDGNWKEAGFEREVSETLAKARPEHKRQGGVLIPTHFPFQVEGAQVSDMVRAAMQKRAVYQVGTASQGGNIVGTELLAADFIEVLRNRTVTGQLGARFLTGLVENVNIPRQNAQTSTFWVGESVALTESEATFDQVQLRPHVVGALSKMSRLMLQQSTPAIEQIVREDLLQVLALAVDAGALYGTGSSSQPTGISNTTNVGSVVGGTNGANWTFDMMIQLYAAPLVANAPQENLAFAINAKTKGYLATLKSTTGAYLWSPFNSIGGPIPDQIVGYRYAVSNQLPYNLTKGTSSGICSMAQFGNWQELFIGEWGVLEILANPYDSTGFTTGDVLIRAFQTIDVGLRHPASFAVISDALTPGF